MQTSAQQSNENHHRLKIFDSLRKQLRTFVPIDNSHVKMYVCGPTVYNYAHIGNARPAVVFDLLSRVLRQLYPKLTYVRNITDVDDKINTAAKQEGVDISVITQRFTKIYHEDLRALHCLPPDIEPTATESMAEMLACISQLLANGAAYEADGHVIFSVSSCDDYGVLSGRSLADNQAGARVDVADYKRNPQDFVLWKPAGEDEPGWDSPWGRGRPGWHIECTAMIKKHAGLPIDIHGGGADLLFPHHENERAQGRCLHTKGEYANYWMHNGMIQMGTDKMSKSLGNILLIRDLLHATPGEVLRLVLIQTRYSQPLIWKEDTLVQAKIWLDKVYRLLEHIPDPGVDLTWSELPEDFTSALEDDLNTPLALHHWYRNMRKIVDMPVAKQQGAGAQVWACARVLGLANHKPSEWFQHLPMGRLSEEKILDMIEKRTAAKKDRDFAKADTIRKVLEDQGVLLEDGPDKTTWRYQ